MNESRGRTWFELSVLKWIFCRISVSFFIRESWIVNCGYSICVGSELRCKCILFLFEFKRWKYGALRYTELVKIDCDLIQWRNFENCAIFFSFVLVLSLVRSMRLIEFNLIYCIWSLIFTSIYYCIYFMRHWRCSLFTVRIHYYYLSLVKIMRLTWRDVTWYFHKIFDERDFYLVLLFFSFLFWQAFVVFPVRTLNTAFTQWHHSRELSVPFVHVRNGKKKLFSFSRRFEKFRWPWTETKYRLTLWPMEWKHTNSGNKKVYSY